MVLLNASTDNIVKAGRGLEAVKRNRTLNLPKCPPITTRYSPHAARLKNLLFPRRVYAICIEFA